MSEPNSVEKGLPREHYLYVNMRDVGCNCGERMPTKCEGGPDERRAQREAWFAEHHASVTPGGSDE